MDFIESDLFEMDNITLGSDFHEELLWDAGRVLGEMHSVGIEESAVGWFHWLYDGSGIEVRPKFESMNEFF